MSRVEKVLRDLSDAFTTQRQRFALVGGLAVSARAEPRFTRDVDVAVAAEYTFVENVRTRDQLPEEFRDALLTALTAYGRVPEITETGDLRE